MRQDYGQLASALQSGNLTDAQSAFAALEQALQTQSGTASTASNTTSTTNDPIANDLNALGQALSSGSLTQAQSAFSQLQSDIQTAEQAANPQTQDAGQWPRADWHDRQQQWGGGSPSSPSTASSSNAYNSRNSSSAINVYA